MTHRSGYDLPEWRNEVYEFVAESKSFGATWAEIAAATGRHHGTVSGALSRLHQDGLICRLSETRDRRRVYVHPYQVHGRTTEPYGIERTCPHCGETFS